jgi:glutamate-1-semialdehyde aminotransferase
MTLCPISGNALASGFPSNPWAGVRRLMEQVNPRPPLALQILDNTISHNKTTNHAASLAIDSEWF